MVWWTSPAKEVLNVLFNRILAPYVENLDMNQVNYGIGQGQLTLRKLRLKKGALDKFRLPVDVIEGHLGTFTLSLHWMNLGNQPVQVLIEDVYLLVVPSPTNNDDPAEEEKRTQSAKQERVENAELLHMRGQAEQTQDDSTQSEGLVGSLIKKILNNLQVTVKNVHVRYEDSLSVPGHPFACGLTLSAFSAASVNEQWQPAFIQSTAGKINKLANLESLAVYFNTDTKSMAGLPYQESVDRFSSLIARDGHSIDHQFVMSPVSGQGKIVMNNKVDKVTPRFDVQLQFDEISVKVDNHQYRDIISLLDMFHFYARQHQYRKYRPSPEELAENKPRALLRFAGHAILGDIHERNVRWTWTWFRQRRDDRNLYVQLFKKKSLNQLVGEELKTFEGLEKKLSYEDIRFYRSIARSQLRKDLALKKRLEIERQKNKPPPPTSTGWTGWIWGSTAATTVTQQAESAADDASLGGPMTDEQRKELYAVLDYDEKTAVAESLNAARDGLKAKVTAKLNKGSFALVRDPHGKATEVISVIFDVFEADVLQRTDNVEGSISLAGFRVFDGTTPNSLYSQIVHVKDSAKDTAGSDADPFFYLKFEKDPLDERADSALTVRLRHMEIIYHKGYVEAVYQFFKPPASQLESVEALLIAASQTLDGIRRETRAGLEYALQTHKTVDIQMDLNAPIIIVPEDITTNTCKHLIIDAGHISIESNLVEKSAIQAIHAKRKQQYTDEDYKRLELMMYDQFSLKLEAAQFLLGNDLASCRNALTSTERDSLHLLERTNMDFNVQLSIVPQALTLARFKVAGNLPTLQINFSDVKYKTLMRLVDVAIPQLGDDPVKTSDVGPVKRASNAPHTPVGLQSPTVFWSQRDEYNIDSDEDSNDGDNSNDKFFDVDAGEKLDLHQHLFELAFSVDSLHVALAKASPGNGENVLGDVVFERFALNFALAQFNMDVDVTLRSLSMSLCQSGRDPIPLLSSTDAQKQESDNLLQVKYVRAQRQSPEFHTVYEGIDQQVHVEMTTFLFQTTPEAILILYDYLMTTFVPNSNDSGPTETSAPPDPSLPDQISSVVDSKIRVLVKLARMQMIMLHGDIPLSTLSLSTAHVSIMLRPSTMVIGGRLGTLSLRDDSPSPVAMPDYKDLLSIEGDNLAEFKYQTFSPGPDNNHPDVNSQFTFKAASVKIHFVEQPLRDMYLFVTKLARLKVLYDAASQAAAQRASEIQRMQFDISVKSPIIVFPMECASSRDSVTLRLGQMTAKNLYKGPDSNTLASLHGIQLASTLFLDAGPSTLKIVDDINIDADINQFGELGLARNKDQPDTTMSIKISDVKLYLTHRQYEWLLDMSESVQRIIAGVPGDSPTAPPSQAPATNSPPSIGAQHPDDPPTIMLQPELRRKESGDQTQPVTTLDLVLAMTVVKLHLFDDLATTIENCKEHGIARLALNDTTVRFKMLSNGASEGQLVLKSFTMSNTRPGQNKYREIIPAAQHDRNQFMVLYTSSGVSQSLAIVTIDSPQVIFAVDPVFALGKFFTTSSPGASSRRDAVVHPSEGVVETPTSSFDFRVDLHDLSVVILEDDAKSETRAISLSIKQVMLSQQRVLALTVDRLGMSLVQMGTSSETVRFLDDVDITLSLDNQTISPHQQLNNIEVSAKSIVVRASYRDILLITSIVNRAIALSTQSAQMVTSPRSSVMIDASSKTGGDLQPSKSGTSSSVARVVMTKEQLNATFDGFRLILIADAHEEPVIHLRTKPFFVIAKDWSSELYASSTLSTQLDFWNLSNSHWEPLFDPWSFTLMLRKEDPGAGITTSLSAKDRIDLNISTTFVDLALTTLNTWSVQGEAILNSARGAYAPYRIRNRTGYSVNIWSDSDGSKDAKDFKMVKVGNEQAVDWRFDDWQTMREVLSTSGQNYIGIQFLEKSWDRVRSIPVNKEGEYAFSLRPRVEKYTDRLLCEVTVEDNVKIVTLRSTYKVENQTLYPLELLLVDNSGQAIQAVQKISPGRDYALPIESVARHKVRLQPDQGFGYKWSTAIDWEDLVAKKTFTVKCAHTDDKEAAFRFLAHVNVALNDPGALKYPRINLRLRAPLELENLLPYNVEYRIYDKNTDQNWRSYLRKGGVMPVHSVELSHLVLLNITIQDTAFKPSEFAIINAQAHTDFDIEKRVILTDQKDRKLDIKLNYVRYPDSGGAFKVQLYAPYIVINKTGLPFSVRRRSSRASQAYDVAGESRPDVLCTPTPFMMTSVGERGHEFTFKVGDSGWSRFTSFEAPSAETGLIMESQQQKSEEIHVGLSWVEGSGKYKLTKVITLVPRFLVKNCLSEPIGFREHAAAPKGRSSLDPGERLPLGFLRRTEEKLLTIAFPGLNAQWSPAVNMEDIGSTHFRLRHPADPDTTRLIRADVQIDASSIFVYFYAADDDWPFLIENDSDHPISFCQTDHRQTEAEPVSRTSIQYPLSAHSSIKYAWDFPAAREKKIQLTINGTRRIVDVMEIGDLVPFKFPGPGRDGSRAVSLDVRAEGQRQVLRISNYVPERSLYKPTRRATGSLSRSDTALTAGLDAFEAISEDSSAAMTIKLDLEGIGISLINRNLTEVVFLSLNNLKCEYTSNAVAQALTVSCGSLQIDNQLHDALFPVVLQPTPIGKEAGGVAALPTVQASVTWLNDQAHGVFFIKYCSILLQALTIEADEDFLFAVYDLAQLKSAAWDNAEQDILIRAPEAIPEPTATKSGSDLYFEVLELQPIRLSLSFMRTERVSGDTKLSTRNPLAVVVNALTMTLGNVNDAPLGMNALVIKDMRLSSAELQNRIMYHYRQEVLRQLYRILGSADFIGNPVGLFTNVSSGVADIFYEPFNGVVMHGNRELGIGIAKGAASFVKKTVFGVTDSMTKFTSSVGKGLSAATMDSDYQLKRRMNQRRNKPRHAIYGVTAGAEAFATSVASGMEGILMKPIEGAETGGAAGFFKGVGKGLVGALTKPAVGMFDLASNVTEGIRNTTTVFDNPARDRVRLPRLIPADGVLRAYSEREALGQFWMKDLEQGKYRKEVYVAHLNLPEGDYVVLVTSSRILCFASKRLRLIWDMPFTSVQGVIVEDTGIRFSHKGGKEHDKFVTIRDKNSQSWFFSQVAAVVKAYNVQRRIDSV